MLALLLVACSNPPEETPPEMEELVWMMLRDFESADAVGEAELLAAWMDETIQAPEPGYVVETPATAYVEALDYSPSLEIGNMSGGLVIRRVRGTLAQYAAVFPEADQSFADDSYETWDRTIDNGADAAWADGADLVADDAIEKSIPIDALLPYPMLRHYRWVDLERGPAVISRAVIYDEGWANDSSGILGGFTIEVFLPDGDHMIWLNCTWTQVISIVGDNPEFYTNEIIGGSTDVMIGTELHVAGPE